MSEIDISFFLPTRKGSERVKNKNTRPFSVYRGGILELKLRQLINTRGINKVILSTNDEESVRVSEEIGSDKIELIMRPENLCLSSTKMDDFIKYIPDIFTSEHIFWVHTTSPFIGTEDYEYILDVYKEKVVNGEYDSLVSVNKIQSFLYDIDNGKFISHDYDNYKWPRSQDLKSFYEFYHAFYIMPVMLMKEQSDRIGRKPYFFETNKLQSFDIDWEDDFRMAELLTNNMQTLC